MQSSCDAMRHFFVGYETCALHVRKCFCNNGRFDWVEFCAVHVRDFINTFKYRRFGAEFQIWLIGPVHVLEGRWLDRWEIERKYFLLALF